MELGASGKDLLRRGIYSEFEAWVGSGYSFKAIRTFSGLMGREQVPSGVVESLLGNTSSDSL